MFRTGPDLSVPKPFDKLNEPRTQNQDPANCLPDRTTFQSFDPRETRLAPPPLLPVDIHFHGISPSPVTAWCWHLSRGEGERQERLTLIVSEAARRGPLPAPPRHRKKTRWHHHLRGTKYLVPQVMRHPLSSTGKDRDALILCARQTKSTVSG